MAHLSGKDGNVSTGTAVSGIKSWTLDYVTDVLETTDFADAGVKTYIVGCSGWSGSFEGFKEGAPQTQGASVSLQLREHSTTTYWSGTALITGTHASDSHDGIVSVAYDFQGNGALNHTEP